MKLNIPYASIDEQIDIRKVLEQNYEPCKKCFGSTPTKIN